MAILGLVVTAIYSSWTAILRASKVGLDAAAAAQRARIALRTLEESLSTVELFARNADYYGFLAQNGDDATLSFVARLPKAFPRSGRFGDFDLRRLTYTVEQSPDGDRALVLRQQPLVMDMDEDEQAYPLILARHVKEFAIGFWDERAADWADEWTQTNQLPRLVKLTLRLQQTDSHGAHSVQEITRLVALTSRGVPPSFQVQVAPGRPMPGVPGVPGAPPGGPVLPGGPGTPGLPGGVPPPGVPPPPAPGQLIPR